MTRSAKPMPEPQQALVSRVRALLAHEPTREVAMFGGRAFMVREAMAVSAGRDGSLLVRVADETGPQLLARPGAAAATMGGRDMGPGWIVVDAATAAIEPELAAWVEVALAHNATTRPPGERARRAAAPVTTATVTAPLGEQSDASDGLP